jgi:hypothetical protein
MILVEHELLHVNEADTESVTAKDSGTFAYRAKDKYLGRGKGTGKGKPQKETKTTKRQIEEVVLEDGTRYKSQPNSRKRQIEDLANDDEALVLVDEEEEGLLIQKI